MPTVLLKVHDTTKFLIKSILNMSSTLIFISQCSNIVLIYEKKSYFRNYLHNGTISQQIVQNDIQILYHIATKQTD